MVDPRCFTVKIPAHHTYLSKRCSCNRKRPIILQIFTFHKSYRYGADGLNHFNVMFNGLRIKEALNNTHTSMLAVSTTDSLGRTPLLNEYRITIEHQTVLGEINESLGLTLIERKFNLIPLSYSYQSEIRSMDILPFIIKSGPIKISFTIPLIFVFSVFNLLQTPLS